MTFLEFVNLDRTEEPALSNEKFRAVLTGPHVVRGSSAQTPTRRSTPGTSCCPGRARG